MQKACIEIADVLAVTGHSVRVMVADTGKPLWLPLKYAEHYNNRVFIPQWLYNKVFSKEHASESV